MPTVYRTLMLVLVLTTATQTRGDDDPPPAYPTTGQEPVEFDLLELPPPPTKITAKPPVTNPAARPSLMPLVRRFHASETSNVQGQAQNFLDIYGNQNSSRALAQLPQRPTTGVTRPPAVRQARKPFEGRTSGPPTISPYLNLFIEESNESLPNYHAFVRPMQRQLNTNRTNQTQLNTLQSEVRQASYQQPMQGNGGGLPATGHGTRYLNTSRFYPTIPRLR